MDKNEINLINETLFLKEDILGKYNSYKEEDEFIKELINKNYLTKENLNLYKEATSSKKEVKSTEPKKSVVKKVSNGVDKVGNTAIMVTKEIKNMIKSIYRTDDEHLSKGTTQLSKLIARAAITVGLFHIPVIGPVCSVIHFFTGLVLKNKNDAASRKRLEDMYKSKLEFVEDKIGRTDDDKEKYQLIKLKNELNSSIGKIKYFDD